MNNNKRILSLLGEHAPAFIGFADLAGTMLAVRSGMTYGICIADAIRTFPDADDYAPEYQAVSLHLREISQFLEESITALGFRAVSLARSHSDDGFMQREPYKILAVRAGFGWIGKSSVLVTKEYGCAVRLHGVITDMPLDTASRIGESLCGDCRACVDACIANAVAGNSWCIGITRRRIPTPFDGGKPVLGLPPMPDASDVPCTACMTACPWTQRYLERLGTPPSTVV